MQSRDIFAQIRRPENGALQEQVSKVVWAPDIHCVRINSRNKRESFFMTLAPSLANQNTFWKGIFRVLIFRSMPSAFRSSCSRRRKAYMNISGRSPLCVFAVSALITMHMYSFTECLFEPSSMPKASAIASLMTTSWSSVRIVQRALLWRATATRSALKSLFLAFWKRSNDTTFASGKHSVASQYEKSWCSFAVFVCFSCCFLNRPATVSAWPLRRSLAQSWPLVTSCFSNCRKSKYPLLSLWWGLLFMNVFGLSETGNIRPTALHVLHVACWRLVPWCFFTWWKRKLESAQSVPCSARSQHHHSTLEVTFFIYRKPCTRFTILTQSLISLRYECFQPDVNV